MLPLTTSHPAGPLYTSLTERLRMLTDSENPHTLCQCVAQGRGRQISQEISVWYVHTHTHTHTQMLSHRPAHTLILITALHLAQWFLFLPFLTQSGSFYLMHNAMSTSKGWLGRQQVTALSCPLCSILKVITLWWYSVWDRRHRSSIESWIKLSFLDSVARTVWWKASLQYFSDWVKVPDITLCKCKSIGPKGKKKKK